MNVRIRSTTSATLLSTYVALVSWKHTLNSWFSPMFPWQVVRFPARVSICELSTQHFRLQWGRTGTHCPPRRRGVPAVIFNVQNCLSFALTFKFQSAITRKASYHIHAKVRLPQESCNFVLLFLTYVPPFPSCQVAGHVNFSWRWIKYLSIYLPTYLISKWSFWIMCLNWDPIVEFLIWFFILCVCVKENKPY